MYKLTSGDLRLIEESTRPWEMTVNPIIQAMEELPDEVRKNIDSLSEQYKNELKEYYSKAMDKDAGQLADPIFNEFDAKWDKEHPEFYDMDKLFEKAGKEDKKRAEEAIKAAKEYFN